MKKGRFGSYEIWQPVLLAAMVVLGMIAGYQLDRQNKRSLLQVFPGDQEIRVGEVEEAIRFLESKYLYDPDEQALTEDAIQQLFSHLDPYSMYMSPSDRKEVEDNMSGNYKGIGIETLILDDTLLVTGVLGGSPAEVAGIRRLDRIIRLDSQDMTGKNLDFPAFRAHFQNQTANQTSRLGIFRKREKEWVNVTIGAGQVDTRSVRYHGMIGDSILYLRIDQFVSRTYREFMELLEANQQNGKIPALIIDVRDNPGGYLDEVTKILSQFFDDADRTLVRTVVRNGKERKYETPGRTFYDIGRIVVLINGNSASGSEVLAGAIQDWDRGLVIGKTSYGKGLVQEQYDLSNGGAIRLTVANYYLPTGRSIQHDWSLDSLFFEGDTIRNGKDESFYSLLLHRPLTGGDGIKPDVAISDSLFERLIYPAFFGNIELDRIIISYLENHPSLYATTREEIQSPEWLPEGSTMTMEWIAANILKNTSGSEMARRLFRAKCAYYLFDEETMLGILLQGDPYIREAQNRLTAAGWLEANPVSGGK